MESVAGGTGSKVAVGRSIRSGAPPPLAEPEGVPLLCRPLPPPLVARPRHLSWRDRGMQRGELAYSRDEKAMNVTLDLVLVPRVEARMRRRAVVASIRRSAATTTRTLRPTSAPPRPVLLPPLRHGRRHRRRRGSPCCQPVTGHSFRIGFGSPAQRPAAAAAAARHPPSPTRCPGKRALLTASDFRNATSPAATVKS